MENVKVNIILDIVKSENECGLRLSPILETFYDLSYLAGYDALSYCLEIDSRELYYMLVDLARKFEDKYGNVVEWGIETEKDYLTTLTEFYQEWKDELKMEYKKEQMFK